MKLHDIQSAPKLEPTSFYALLITHAEHIHDGAILTGTINEHPFSILEPLYTAGDVRYINERIQTVGHWSLYQPGSYFIRHAR